MSFITTTSSGYTEKVINKLSDLPSPVAGIITLEDNVTYRFKGMINIGSNRIVLGASNTLYGLDKSDDGIIYTGLSSCISGTNTSGTISNLNLYAVAGTIFSITNTLAYSFQVRECILYGNALGIGTFNGGLILAFNNNIIGNTGDLNITGVFSKVGVATNYWVASSGFTNLIHFNTVTADTVKAIDNDFIVPAATTGIKVTSTTINATGGGSIIGNTFSGMGTYIDGVAVDTLDWIIENNGRDVLNTSDLVTQKKVRSEAELDLYLALPDPTIYSYILDAQEFIITKPITVPGTGVNAGLTFFGLGNNYTTLKTVTPNIAMFNGGGNLFLNDMIVSAQGTNSQVFDMTSTTGFEAVEMVNVNFQNCESLGSLSGYRQGLIINGFMIGDKQGLLFKGTWSDGFRIDSSRFIFTPVVGSYMFKGDVGQTFGSRFVSNANATIGTGSIGYDFVDANFVNDASFQLVEAQFDGGGTYVNSITASSRKSLWRDCVGVDDTFQGCVYVNNVDRVTAIGGIAVYAELATNLIVVEDVWFESQTTGFFTPKYLSSLPINIRIDLSLALSSGTNNEVEIEVRLYDSTNTTYTRIDTFKLTTNGGTLGTRVEPVSVPSFARIAQDERIRVFIRNNSAVSNISLEKGSKIIISKR